MKIVMPNYDKPSRCPQWSGSRMKWADEPDTCQNGDIRSIMGDNIYPTGSKMLTIMGKRFFFPTTSLLPGKCNKCGVYTVPFNLTWIDRKFISK